MSTTLRRIALATLALAVGCSWIQQGPGAPGPAAEEAAPVLLENLYTHRAITTRSAEAQRYFDQGLALTYGFNHEAAARSFAHAAELDPGCAMCLWGEALTLGPNINAPMGPEAGLRAYQAARQALALAPGASPVERDLIAAVAKRYGPDPAADREALDRAFADAMRGVRARHPEDVDVAVITAESLMDLSPWNYWTPDATPREDTEEVLALLDWALERDPQHVGANHYLIHAVEEYYPERGVAAAERLAAMDSDAGHLVHMPSHIFWRVGRYEDALEINQRAVAADEAYFSWCRPGAFYRAAYYPHNIHFLWAAASAEGRAEIAITQANRLAAETRQGMAEFPFLEEFVAIPMFTRARFGRWDAALGEPAPDPSRRYLTGVWHYTRGLARVRKGELEAAAAEHAALSAVVGEQAVADLMVAGGTASARTLLEIGERHLAGELAAARGDADAGVAALEQAVALQDRLVYMEPPPWYFPTRQALGAVLLDAGRAAEAEAVYRRDLEQFPKNGWSLFGLARSLAAQDRRDEAAWAREGFARAWANADVELPASRF